MDIKQYHRERLFSVQYIFMHDIDPKYTNKNYKAYIEELESSQVIKLVELLTQLSVLNLIDLILGELYTNVRE